jgi:hypothetical protein
MRGIKVFGIISAGQLGQALPGDWITAARQDGRAQLIVFVTGRRDLEGVHAFFAHILPCLQLQGETLSLTFMDTAIEPDSNDDRNVVFTLAAKSPRSSEDDSVLNSYFAKEVARLKNCTREEGRRVLDRILVLMRLIEHGGNRTAVARSLKMQRIQVINFARELAEKGDLPPGFQVPVFPATNPTGKSLRRTKKR